MKTTIARTLTLILSLIVAAAAQASSANLVLRLHDTQGHTFTYRSEVDGSRYADGSTPSPTELAGHLLAAKVKMADELGYTVALHGKDHYKVLGAVRVVGAWIEAGGRSEALGWFRGERDDAE
jgi:hypothetical protein